MFNSAPDDYICPFCLLAQGVENHQVSSRQSDIVYEDALIIAFICSRQWPNNKGHIMIIPREHYENIFDLPDFMAARIHSLARQIAIAMKLAYGCDGISTRQHNGAHGNQEVWHYHLHVFPRYENDGLYQIPQGDLMSVEKRAGYAALLKAFLNYDRVHQLRN